MGLVQDTPVSTMMIFNECMIYHMKVHIFSYNLGPKKFSKSRIHIFPNYGQTDSKTAIVTTDLATSGEPPSGCGIPLYANDQWCDDENNNPSCNFDGGACCDNNISGWDDNCTVIYNHAFAINNPCLTYLVIFSEM